MKVFSGGTRPGTWWQSACGQPSLGPPRAGPPSKFVCRFPRFRPFFVVLCRLFRRLCCRGRCVGCVFSLFSAFVVVVAWVPFPVCSLVVSRFRCSFVFVGVSLFSLFLRCLVVPSIPQHICFHTCHVQFHMGKATSCFGFSPSRHPLPCSVRVLLHVFYSSAQSVCAYLEDLQL